MKYEFVKKLILFLLFILFLVCIIILVFTPNISLNDDKYLKVSYNDDYKEPGYKASFMGKDYHNRVIVSGHVNTKKLGEYVLTYKVSNSIFTSKVKRTIEVIDTEKPSIRLTGGDVITICPNEKYKEKGYVALDNYDHDLTDKVKIETFKDKIIYSVSDSSLNKTKVVRDLIYEDKKKPEIVFDHSSPEYVMEGSTYNSNVFYANDNCDGDVSKKVIVNGNVDTSKPGKYTLKYKVSDNAGNEDVVTRTVIVQNKDLYTPYGCGIKAGIFLTFDDGPSNGTTEEILNILKDEGVKATFFVTNGGPDNLIKREYDEGHAIGIHTASHRYNEVYASVDSYFNDLDIVFKRIERITGKQTKIIRFPGGSSNTVSAKYSPGIMSELTNEVINKGYKYYDWNVDSEDAGRCAGGTASCVYENVVSHLSTSRCNMVLMHDIKFTTAGALRDIISYGKANGYSFYKIDANTPMVKQKVNN